MNQTDPLGSRLACRDSPLLVIQPRRICPAVVPMYEYKTRPHFIFQPFVVRSIRIGSTNFFQRLPQRSHLQPNPRSGFCHGSAPKRVTVSLRNWSAMWLAVQCTIQVECGTDQGEMREGLRKVPERFAASPYLFGVQPQMIGVSQHPFKQQPGFRQFRTIDASCPGERFHQPKRTHGKRAFSPCEPVLLRFRCRNDTRGHRRPILPLSVSD